MTQLTLNLQGDSEATGGTMTPSSQVASLNHANHSALPENEKAQMMNATCGMKCYEQYVKLKPKWVIAENVFGITNIDGGMVFEQVCLDLENEGYEVQPFIIPAAAKNAPHRRDRCWFIAQNAMHSGCVHRGNEQERTKIRQQRNSCTRDSNGVYISKRNATDPDSNGQHECNGNDEINASEGWINAQCDIEQSIVDGNATDTDKFSNNNQSNIRSNTKIIEERRSEGERLFTGKPNRRNCQNNGDATDTMCKRQSGKEYRNTQSGQHCQNSQRNDWNNFPTQSPICSGDDGLPTELDRITFPKWRNESIKGYGNAIVPQIALQLFQIIENESKNQNT